LGGGSERIVKSNVAIAAAVTAYARIHMIKYKLSSNIYYTDTDSIFIDESLPDNEIGKELGLMKDELDGCVIEKAIFLGIKQYGYIYTDKNGIKQEKSVFAGISRDSLKFSEVEDIFNNKIITKEIPIRFYKSFKDLNINIKSTKVSIMRNDEKILFNNVYLPKYIKCLDHKLDNRTFITKIINKMLNLLKKYFK
jgi:hypothetical protein